jgi:hypothetical protein
VALTGGDVAAVLGLNANGMIDNVNDRWIENNWKERGPRAIWLLSRGWRINAVEDGCKARSSLPRNGRRMCLAENPQTARELSRHPDRLVVSFRPFEQL